MRPKMRKTLVILLLAFSALALFTEAQCPFFYVTCGPPPWILGCSQFQFMGTHIDGWAEWIPSCPWGCSITGYLEHITLLNCDDEYEYWDWIVCCPGY